MFPSFSQNGLSRKVIACVWAAMGIYVLIVVLAGLLASEPYSIKAHTISQLAGQGFANAWIMRMGFIILGIAATVASLLFYQRPNKPFGKTILLLLGTYGVSIFFTGIFSTLSINTQMPNLESSIHSSFAQLAGFSFIAAIVIITLTFKENRSFVWFSILTFLLIGAFSALFFFNSDLTGIWQRALQAISLFWLAVGLHMINITDQT